MRVLIVGAGGFIGRALAARLAAAGHAVVPAGRNPAALDGLGEPPVPCDLAGDGTEQWLPRLDGIGAVINTVGIFRESESASFRQIHTDGPIALFEACRRAHVGRIVQLSALGADEDAATAYHRSKRAADDWLRRHRPEQGDPDWVILRPSLVIGRGGASTALLARLGRLPLRPAVAKPWMVQPVALDDLADLVAAVVAAPGPVAACIDAVGPEAMPFDRLAALLGRWAGSGGGVAVRLPGWVWSLAARFGDAMPGQPFGRDALAMLRRGNTGDPAAMARWLGRPPRRIAAVLAAAPQTAAERLGLALAPWRLPLRLSLAVLWIATGLVSLFVHPVADSLAMLARVGLAGNFAWAALIGAAVWDLALGTALLAGWRVVWVARLQIATMLVFTAIIAAALPEWLAHPFGPVTKNLPILVATVMLIPLERNRHG